MARRVVTIGIVGWLLACAGSPAAEKLDRGLVALKTGEGKVYLGWRLLAEDPETIAFDVYRKTADEQASSKLNSEPVRDRTNFVDEKPIDGAKYTVRPLQPGGQGSDSPPASVADTPAGASYVRIKLQGDYRFQKAALADLDGDGRLDYVIKQPDFNTDPYQKPGYWKKSEDTYKIEAYALDGRFLWRHDMGWSIEAGTWYAP